MIGKINGTVMSSTIKTPVGKQKFEPHHLIKILQKHKGDAKLESIKDFDLTKKYVDDQKFEAMCEMRHYDFGGNNGMTTTVIN